MSIEEIIKSIPTRHVKNGRVVHRRADEFQEEVLTKLADRAASAAGESSRLEQIKERYTGTVNEGPKTYEVHGDDLAFLINEADRSTPRTEPDIFADALASQIDAIRRAAFDQAIQIVDSQICGLPADIQILILDQLLATRDATPTKKPRSDKGKHHHVAGVLQEDVDEAEN